MIKKPNLGKEEQYNFNNSQPTQTPQTAPLPIIQHVILHRHKINF